MIDILVNSKTHSFTSEISLQELLQSMQLSEARGVAIAVNEEVIPKRQWPQHTVCHHDKVLIIQASQGG